jgi:hypothetical protein
MTLAIHDTEGYVGNLGSASGLSELAEAFAPYPLINSFLQNGFSEQLDGLEAELELAIQKATEPEIRDGGELLLGLIHACENSAFITDE